MKKVLVGMSGGVDSSVAAYLLKQQGYEVFGVTLDLRYSEEYDFLAERDAKAVAGKLGIEHFTAEFKSGFREKIIKYFAEEYQNGRTPNPCIICNPQVKWRLLLEKAEETGADYVATGHYAQVMKLQNGRYTLKTSKTGIKDQSYALFNLRQEQLSKTLMPLWEYDKTEVRKIAEEAGLPVAKKPDSQEICFIPDDNYGRFLEEFAGGKMPSGDFVDTTGKVLGKHRGLWHYTIGQRKNLGIAIGKPTYVKKIDAPENRVVLADDCELFESTVYIENVSCMGVSDIDGEIRGKGKIRYNHKAAGCVLKKADESRIICVFDQPQRAITPGQAAVFYDENNCIICGGIICK